MRDQASIELTIASGGQNTALAQIKPARFFALLMPGAFTGTTMTVWGARGPDDTPVQLFDDGGVAVSITVAAARVIGFSDAVAKKIAALPYVQFRSGSVEIAERTIILLTKG